MKKSLVNSAAFLWNKHTSTKALGVLPALVQPNTQSASRRSVASSPRRTIHPTLGRGFSSSSSTAVGTVSDRGGVILQGVSTALHLPPADDPVGLQLYKKALYCPTSRILRTSAHVGSTDDNQKANGIVGDDVTPQEARNHARNSGLRLLATIHDALEGDLDRVEQVLHLKGLVKSTSDFTGHAGVIDGCCEVLVEAFGPDVGIGTRECFGVGSLGATVACVLEVKVRPPE